MPIRISFSTLACPDWSWAEILQHGPAAGYDGVEVRLLAREPDLLARPEFQPGQLATRRSELADQNFRICGLASSVRFDQLDAVQRQKQVDIGRRYLDLAGELGAEFVRVFGDVIPQPADVATEAQVVDEIAEGLLALGNHAAGAGVQVLIETHGDFADSRRMERLMQIAGGPQVGVLWDTHHPWRFFQELVEETYDRLRPWVRHTHWKDSVAPRRVETPDMTPAMREAEEAARRLMSGHRTADYVLFGQGEFPAAETVRVLQADGYSGWCSLEWEKAWHPQLAAPEVALPAFPPVLRSLWDAESGDRPQS